MRTQRTYYIGNHAYTVGVGMLVGPTRYKWNDSLNCIFDCIKDSVTRFYILNNPYRKSIHFKYLGRAKNGNLLYRLIYSKKMRSDGKYYSWQNTVYEIEP